MAPEHMEAVVFGLGVALGGGLMSFASRRIDQTRIESALNTVGITRKEFLEHSAAIDSIHKWVKDAGNRIGYLERCRK